ncbi:MAG: pyruvate, phosphate dikinase [Bacillota bacterium]
MGEDTARSRYIYRFEDGSRDMKDLLGGKGANLAEMTSMGLPVPPGFTITTRAAVKYRELGGMPDGLEDEIWRAMTELERTRGRQFGSRLNPLLVSVRSGAPISMPGMMDTILNLGLNDETVRGLAEATGDERFALDCLRRFIQMFGNVVRGISTGDFERLLESVRHENGVSSDHELSSDALREIIERYKDLYEKRTGEPFPEDPRRQLLEAVEAVFASWDNRRAVKYREHHGIPDDLGTAVNVQTMVFGNLGQTSGTGVLFTRDPANGEPNLYGEFLQNAQGEDVVAGIRTPRPVDDMADSMPEIYERLNEIAHTLEAHYGDVQDIEFTVEEGDLFLLQTRGAKRTPAAAVRIAHDMVREDLISKEEALMRVDPEKLSVLLHPSIDLSDDHEPMAHGLPASPGAATGKVVFDPDEAERRGTTGERVLLMRPETTPDDIHGIVGAQGIVTSRGGMTCHAAIVARGMGKACVVGCSDIVIDLEKGVASVGPLTIESGDLVTIDGSTGAVFLGEMDLIEPVLTSHFRTFLGWADGVRRLGVRANADTPHDAALARDFGAEGIGLCRTEHMFMQPERLRAVQKMIMANTSEERREALKAILPLQRSDFVQLFTEMDGLPVTIRLLDPPLHEFLPDVDELRDEIRQMRSEGAIWSELAVKEELYSRAVALEEVNPMLGLRGCRLGITRPEIYEMQVKAIFEAMREVRSKDIDIFPEIMIPLVSDVNEFRQLATMIRRVAEEVGDVGDYSVGTMIEVPRACITADEIAGEAEFFSFGTNDLTQTVFGFSRDDAEAKFLHQYLADGILDDNPFSVLDVKGVGELVKLGVRRGREARDGLKVGICGEHGGDPRSIDFCHRVAMDYVSCSPYRIPIARLAAAQAALKSEE